MHIGKVLRELSGGRLPNRVLCTGHSLGGALATLGAPCLRTLGNPSNPISARCCASCPAGACPTACSAPATRSAARSPPWVRPAADT